MAYMRQPLSIPSGVRRYPSMGATPLSIPGGAKRYPMGLAGPSDCGAGQIWDPNFVYAGLPPGQCVTQAQSDQNKAANPSQYSGGSDFFGSLLSGVSSFFGAQQAANNAAAQQAALLAAQQNQGMSPTTMIVLGGGALLVLAMLMKSRSSG